MAVQTFTLSVYIIVVKHLFSYRNVQLIRPLNVSSMYDSARFHALNYQALIFPPWLRLINCCRPAIYHPHSGQLTSDGANLFLELLHVNKTSPQVSSFPFCFHTYIFFSFSPADLQLNSPRDLHKTMAPSVCTCERCNDVKCMTVYSCHLQIIFTVLQTHSVAPFAQYNTCSCHTFNS